MSEHLQGYKDKKIKELSSEVSKTMQQFLESDPILCKLDSPSKTDFIMNLLVMMVTAFAGMAIDRKSFAIHISQRIANDICLNEDKGIYEKVMKNMEEFMEFRKDQKMDN